MKKLQFCLVMLSVLLLALGAMAQIQNGQFSGTVTDPSGAAIPNVKLTVTNTGTNLSVTTTTNSTGAYTVKELPPGSYKITAEAAGFRTVNNTSLTLNAGTIEHVDFKMTLGQAQEVVEVTSEATAVNTEESKLATTVGTAQINNLPLNGRNVYDLMQLAPGAVNVNGVDMEAGHGTVVNGLREDFNGFLINGVANKGLSGGVNNTPIQDTVQEFQQLQLNVSAQYGTSAGSINNLVTKSGTNAFHGSLWEYVRNDVFDANEYFLNQANSAKPPLRFNQFGGTIGGPIIKDKLFFFGSYQGDRFKTTGVPQTITTESPEWRQTVQSALPNSTAALLYKNFAPSIAGTPSATLDQFVPQILDPLGSGFKVPDYSAYLCPNINGISPALATTFQGLLGVTAQDQANATANGCTSTLPLTAGAANRSAPFLNTSTAIFGAQTQALGNLFNGNEGSGRLDYNLNQNNRIFAQFNWLKTTDSFGPCSTACTRGFSNPARDIFPNGQFSFVHTFSPTILNEFRAGYTQNNTGVGVSLPGVPSVLFDDGTVGFGSYNGYPQFFKEHDYSYSDMVSISHGNHNIKTGVDIKRNIENSEFDIARGSYYFFDSIYFAADAPYGEAAGVNPGFTTNQPGALGDNVRHFRNLEFGAYFQDDWKVTKRLTLNLGLRYDLFTRHNELDGLTTTFVPGPGIGLAQQIANANVPFSTLPGSNSGFATTCNPLSVTNPNTQVLQGVCGPGGFAAAPTLGPGDHNNFGPRVGFAWDVFGTGKTSIRGGFGVSYESTLYNPLSNSRWNPPFYSFNAAFNGLVQPNNPSTVVYGPTTCTNGANCVPSGAPPTFTGTGTNPGQGIGAQAVGNINGWASSNPDQAKLTGIVLPSGIKDPYVYNFFFSLQHEIAPKLVVEADYVGTAAHKLFRSSDINSQAGGFLLAGDQVVDNLGRTLTGLQSPINGVGRPNANYGTLRTWENAVNSNYNALQLSVKKQMSHGILINAAYTWSHSLDDGSTWHSGATTATGGSGGDGYLTDQSIPGLDYGNSVFDIRQRLVVNYVIELPGQKMHGALGWIAGGWNLDGIWSFQSGAHWSPYASNSAHLTGNSDPTAGPLTGCYAVPFVAANCQNTGGDFNLNRISNDRPDSSVSGATFSRNTWANGWCAGANGFDLAAGCDGATASGLPTLSAPCLACTGNLGRNTFVGPGQWYADMTLAKNFKITERFNLKFEASAFNIFNRANFILAAAGGGGNNHLTQPNFGQAGATLNARNMQLGLKLSF
jgi:hypothetical protein